eukprot:3382351-Amphidinium_carterae.1
MALPAVAFVILHWGFATDSRLDGELWWCACALHMLVPVYTVAAQHWHTLVERAPLRIFYGYVAALHLLTLQTEDGDLSFLILINTCFRLGLGVVMVDAVAVISIHALWGVAFVALWQT